MKVGCPIMKLKTSGKQVGRSGSMQAVVREAFPDATGRRYSKDADEALTATNEYTGFSTAQEVLDEIERRVAEYDRELKAQGKPGVRSDAVKAIAMIVKPPCEEINTWDEPTRAQFWEDTLWVMGNILGEQNVIATAKHKDEAGEHIHFVAMPFTSDGRLCAKEYVNIQFFRRLNREYPMMMRAKGWNVEELKVFDEEAVKNMTEDEAAEYKANYWKKRKERKANRSVEEYRRDKNNERSAELDDKEKQVEAMAAQAAADRAEAERLDNMGLFGLKAEAKQRLKDIEERERSIDAREKALCERVEAYEAGLEARAREIAAEQFKAASGALKPSEREIYEALRTQELEMNGKRVTFEQFGRMLAMKKRKQKPLEQVEERLVQEVKQEPKPSLDDLISRAEAVSRQEAAKKLASGIRQPSRDEGLSL